MGLCETSNFSIFTFNSASHLKFSTHSITHSIALQSHFTTLLSNTLPSETKQSQFTELKL